MDRANRHSERKPETEITWKKEERDASAPYISVNCIEVTGDDSPAEINVDVVIEERFDIFLNDSLISSFPAGPRDLKELAVGHLIAEGYIGAPADLVSFETDGNKLLCRASGSENMTVPDSGIRVGKDVLFGLIDHIFEDGKIWRRTGGAHSAIIATPEGEVLAFCEDGSRAAAADKAIGKAALDGVKLNGCILATSGRLSAALVGKAVNAGIPMMVSKAAPLDKGIRLAEAHGLTLVGFARRPNLYVYSGSGRLEL